MTLGYGTILGHLERGPLRFGCIGCLFGAGAGFAMVSGTEFPGGTLIDARGVMLALSGPIGGPLAAVVASLVASLVRFLLGGDGMTVGIVLIWLTAALGLAFARIVTPGGRPSKTRHFLYLGLLICLPSLTFFARSLGGELGDGFGEVAMRVILPLCIAKVVGVLALGRFIAGTRKRFIATQLLEHQALLDPLTGLANRRSLERNSDAIIDRARRRNEPVAALVIDIDHFKRVNDRFGHEMGDTMLRTVAATILANLRAGDAAARYGGEEIVVLLPRTGAAEASRIAERIRAAIGREIHHLAGTPQTLTVSIGVCSHRGDDLNFKTLFKAADEALYRAKDGGRDKVEVARQMQAAA
nr:diguanylate cyclase [Jiella avicenniae]